MAQADLIINNNVHFENSLRVIVDHLQQKLPR
jgi:hypothetical protein